MVKEQDDIEFIDAEEMVYQKEKITFRGLVLKHLGKISEISTKEFKEGYWQRKPVVVSGATYISEVYIEDRRDAYINAVEYLHDLLISYFDKDIKEQITNLNKKQKESFAKYKDTDKKSEWTLKKLKFRRELFQYLSQLLFRLKYLEKKSISQ